MVIFVNLFLFLLKEYIRPCILEVVVISFHYMQIVEFVIDLRLLVCARDKTYNLP